MKGGKPAQVALTVEDPEVEFGVKIIEGDGTINGATVEIPLSSVALTR